MNGRINTRHRFGTDEDRRGGGWAAVRLMAAMVFVVAGVGNSSRAGVLGVTGVFVPPDGTNTGPSSAYNTDTSPSRLSDNKWTIDDTGSIGPSFASFPGYGEDSPQLTETVSSVLNPTFTYNIRVVYEGYDSDGSYYGIWSALLGNTLQYNTSDSTNAEATGSANFYQAIIGQVSGVTGFSVIADDNLIHPSTDERDYFYGVSYEAVSTPEPASLALMVPAGLLMLRRRKQCLA